jgi:hypothetical protein
MAQPTIAFCKINQGYRGLAIAEANYCSGYHRTKSLTSNPKPQSQETGRVPHVRISVRGTKTMAQPTIAFCKINHGCRGLAIAEANYCSAEQE